MQNKLIIIGAGGQGKVLADIACKCGYTDIAFLDDATRGECAGIPIIGAAKEAERYVDSHTEFVIAFGDNETRARYAQAHSLPFATLIHPSAQIARGATIGKGTVVMANAVIGADAVVGNHCVINTAAIVEHDNCLGDYVHLSPNAVLGGTVKIGAKTQIGLGAKVKNNISICQGCVIGVGAAVVKDIAEAAVYVGIPAKRLEK